MLAKHASVISLVTSCVTLLWIRITLSILIPIRDICFAVCNKFALPREIRFETAILPKEKGKERRNESIA